VLSDADSVARVVVSPFNVNGSEVVWPPPTALVALLPVDEPEDDERSPQPPLTATPAAAECCWSVSESPPPAKLARAKLGLDSGMPRSILADRGVDGDGFDIVIAPDTTAELAAATHEDEEDGGDDSVGESRLPSTFPSSFQILLLLPPPAPALVSPVNECAESYGGEWPIPESCESPQPHSALPILVMLFFMLLNLESKLLLSMRLCKCKSSMLLILLLFGGCCDCWW